MKQKLFTLFLALVVSVGTMFAAWGNTMALIGEFYYRFDTSNGLAQIHSAGPTIKYDKVTSATIPETVDYNSVTYTVTSINQQAFINCSYLKKITFPNSLTDIGSLVFYSCISLDSIVIPSSVTSVGERAFDGCTNLKTVTINSDAVINQSYTQYSNLINIFGSQVTEYIIGDSVRGIGDGAFWGYKELKKVTIGNGVVSIGYGAFYDCTALNSVTMGNSVKNIGERAFISCRNLSSITLPRSVNAIENGAFMGCSNLSAITILGSIDQIGQDVFSGCTQLKAVHINDIAVWCGMHFEDENSNPLIFAQNLYCNGELVMDLIIPEGVQYIGYHAFYGYHKLTSVHLPSSLMGMDNTSIYSKNLMAINVDSKNKVFKSKDGVLLMGNYLYQYPSGRKGEYKIPSSIGAISANAFYGAFVSLICHENINNILPGAFGGSYLASLTFLGETPFTTENINFLEGISCPIYVPCGSLETYRSAWSSVASLITHSPLPYALTCKVYPENAGKINTISNVCELPMEATPNYGYHFMQWSDGVTDNPRAIELTQDTTFTAVFEKNNYAIITTTEMPEWGIAHDTIQAPYLGEVYISATANEHYYFESWHDGNTENPRKITVKGDSIFKAVFAPDKHRIETYVIGDGQVYGPEVDGYGMTVTLSAVPNFGYHFTQWSDGVTDNPRSFILTQDTTFTAEFALDTYGQCGNNLYWKYEDGKLALTGSGDMYQYTQSTIPWVLWKSEIKSVSCSPEMTSLSDYAFSDINTSKFNIIILPTNLVSIGAHAFDGDSFLETIDFGANLEYIGNYAFRGCIRVLNMTIWSEFTPNVGYYALDDISNYAELSVLSTALKKYQVDPNWNRFLLKELGATQTTTTGEVTVEPGDNTAVFTWPTDSKAASYTIEITKGGEVICTLVFNANGQLTGIAFTPGKDGQSNAPAATLTASGMQFTVTGLDAATNYVFSLSTKDNAGSVIAAYSGTFGTTGAPQALANPSAKLDGTRKILRDGQIYILRGDKTYTLTGQEVQ